MRNFLRKTSLSAQIFALTAVILIATSAVALLVVGTIAFRMGTHRVVLDDQLRWELTIALCLTAPACIGVIMAAVRHLLLAPMQGLQRGLNNVAAGRLETVDSGANSSRDWQNITETFDRMVLQLRESCAAHEQAQQVLAERTLIVDRLLEFSQTIQGAGQADQVFSTLTQFLQTQLGLAGVAILCQDPMNSPPMSIASVRPTSLLRNDHAPADLDAGLCPCLRQNLPEDFPPGQAGFRCVIEHCLQLPDEYPAYCIPITAGHDLRVVIHMVLPPEQTWTDQRRRLAQTYVNSAGAALMSLRLLVEAEKQSMTDALTGLFNRRSMDQLLRREVALAARHDHALTLIMVDMDHFKMINDAYGHAAGDHVLKAFADCLRASLRKTDLAFRFGGDEFVIALPQTTIGPALGVVDKLRQALAAVDFGQAIAHLQTHPTMSFGISQRLAAHKVLSLDELLTSADQALYEAKMANRNCVKVYQPPQAA